MRKLTAILTLLCLCGFNQGCAIMSSTTINKEAMLKERVIQAYEYLKERNDKFFNYSVKDESFDETKRIKMCSLLRNPCRPEMIKYVIKKISIDGDSAKVRMESTLQIKDKNNSAPQIDTFKQYDCLVFEDKDWYIIEFSSTTECE